MHSYCGPGLNDRADHESLNSQVERISHRHRKWGMCGVTTKDREQRAGRRCLLHRSGADLFVQILRHLPCGVYPLSYEKFKKTLLPAVRCYSRGGKILSNEPTEQ